METLLFIDSSPRKDAVSRKLTKQFVAEWQKRYPEGVVQHLDVGRKPLEHLDDDLIDALRRNPDTLDQRQLDTVAASDEMIASLQKADMIVIGAPMHNFTITGALRTWIDHIARPAKTFGYGENGPEGLLSDKPVYVISTRGGQYGDGDPKNPHPADFQSGYLRHILGFIGLKSVTVIAANNGMDMGDEPRAAGLVEAETRIADVFSQASAR